MRGQVLVWALEAVWSHGERLLASVLRGGGYRGGVDCFVEAMQRLAAGSA